MAKTKAETKPKGISLFTTIDFGTFDGKILFSCGFQIKELIAELSKQDCGEWNKGLKIDSKMFHKGACAYASKYNFNVDGEKRTYYYLIIKDPFNFTDQEYTTLAHECLHLVQFRLIDILNRDNELECEAYLHSYLMNKCLSHLRLEAE